MKTYIFRDDSRIAELNDLVKKRGVEVIYLKQPEEIDCTERFVVLNSDDKNHHRTLEILKNCNLIDGLFLLDEHDDITLGQMVFEDPGQGNWVEHVLRNNLCKVVFVWQDYWSTKLSFRGSDYVGLLRTNLHRYKLDSVYFTCFRKKNTLLYCDKKTFRLIVPDLRHIQDIEAIEKIYILDEEVGNIGCELREDKVDIFSRNELIWETHRMFEYLYPVFLIKWKDIEISELPLKDVYISVDLDVTLETAKICSFVEKVRRGFNVVGADIYGVWSMDWLQKMTRIYDEMAQHDAKCE